MVKIMVVDDEPNLIELVSAVLEVEGFEIIPASSGKECIEKLKSVKPDLILIDMMMPSMSGRETCELIRNNPETKNIKILFVTVARFSESGKDVLTKLKIKDYITKPFDNKDLVKRVKKALG